jgi:hypothetical protein
VVVTEVVGRERVDLPESREQDAVVDEAAPEVLGVEDLDDRLAP